MARFNEQSSFRPAVLFRYLCYGLVVFLVATGLRYKAPTYACFAGWKYSFGQVQVLYINGFTFNAWTVKRDCLLGPNDRYNPKDYQHGAGNYLPPTSQP